VNVSTLKGVMEKTRQTEEERNRIAYKLLIKLLGKDKDFLLITDRQTIQREIPNTAKGIQESPESVWEFYADLLPRVIASRMGCSEVSLVWRDKN
jgi:hypothetical protein